MSKNVFTIARDDMVVAAAEFMAEKDVGSLPVVSGGKLVGMLTERDLVRRVVASARDPSEVKVNEVMSTPVVSVKPDSFLEEVADLMVKHGIRRIPVIDEGRLVGIVTSTDLAKFVSAHAKFFSALTRAYFEET